MIVILATCPRRQSPGTLHIVTTIFITPSLQPTRQETVPNNGDKVIRILVPAASFVTMSLEHCIVAMIYIITHKYNTTL